VLHALLILDHDKRLFTNGSGDGNKAIIAGCVVFDPLSAKGWIPYYFSLCSGDASVAKSNVTEANEYLAMAGLCGYPVPQKRR